VVRICAPALDPAVQQGAIDAARFAAAGLTPTRVCNTEEQVTHGKPDPEGYLRAASALGGVDPAICLVLEDAPAGVAAGRAAGMHVIGVLTSHPEPALHGAHALVGDLVDVAAVAARLVG
jgi:sugar-phosphatase